MTKKPTPVLVIKHLTKHYDRRGHGIDDINLTVMKGEVFGFLGPNGAGKSTTINTIINLLQADHGTISVFGLDNKARSTELHRRIGYLSGDMETDPSLTGAQYLNFAASLRGGVPKENIASLVKRLQCDTTTKIKHLSRGNKQKIGLVATLMHDPELLILDEPTSGLDPLIQSEFNAIIRERTARDKTTFISSHVLSEVQAICDRVGFIRNGKLIVVKPLDELIDSAPRRVKVSFDRNIPTKKIAALDGVTRFESDETELSFSFSGNINQLLHVLSAHTVRDVRIFEPDLEELFMHYYQPEEESAHVS